MKLKSNKALRIIFATNGLILFAAAMLGPIYALFVEEVGGDLLDASFAAAIFALVAGITALFSGYYSDKLPDNKIVLMTGYVSIALGFAIYMHVESMVGLAVAQMILGFGEAIYGPAFDEEFTRHIDKGYAGREWSYWETMNYFSIAIGAPVGGMLVSKFGFDVMFGIMSLLCVTSVFILLRLPRNTI